MFINAKEVTRHRYDICVVGAGAAGLSIVGALEDSGLSILLIEGGEHGVTALAQELNGGVNTGLDYYPLESTRLRAFGGTTGHWAGQSCLLDPVDFSERDWIGASGWPISYEEYMRHVPRAQAICDLGLGSFVDTSSHGLGDDFVTKQFLYPKEIPRFGPRYSGDVSRSSVHCLLGCSVVSIQLSVKKSEVECVHLRSLDREDYVVEAGRFVLACGAIQNIRLLLNSDDRDARGVGNEFDNVGRYFMEHPNLAVGRADLIDQSESSVLARPRRIASGYRSRTDIRLSDARQRELEVLNHSIFLTPVSQNLLADSWVGSATDVVRFWGRIESKLRSELGYDRFLVRYRMEHAPNRSSRVTLDNSTDRLGVRYPRVNLKFSEHETRTISRVLREFGIALGSTGAGRLRIDFSETDERRFQKLGWQHHHMGGTRMSIRPEDGVVDVNCRVHGLLNLYIAGSSIWPVGGHANPTMNLIALSLRLAEHLLVQGAQNRGS